MKSLSASQQSDLRSCAWLQSCAGLAMCRAADRCVMAAQSGDLRLDHVLSTGARQSRKGLCLIAEEVAGIRRE